MQPTAATVRPLPGASAEQPGPRILSGKGEYDKLVNRQQGTDDAK